MFQMTFVEPLKLFSRTQVMIHWSNVYSQVSSVATLLRKSARFYDNTR